VSKRFVLPLCLAVAALLYGVASASAATVVQGPFSIDNAAIANAGMAELAQNLGNQGTGWDADGECFPSMRCWFVAAGGPTNVLRSGGHISTYLSAGAVTVQPADAQRGDVIQLENASEADGWPDGVHTAVIVANHGGATFDVIQANAPGNDAGGNPVPNPAGTVAFRPSWDPFVAAGGHPGFRVHIWRLGKIRTTIPDWATGHVVLHDKKSGASYTVDPDGARHWIANGGTYLCFTAWYDYKVVQASQARMAPLPEALRPDGSPDAAPCQAPDYLKGAILRYAPDGTSYYVDGNHVRHWIADGETWYCMVAQGSVINVTSDQLSALPQGGTQTPCLDPNRILGKVVRATDGTSYWVDWSGWWHWIKDGGTWQCLVNRYGLINNVSWTAINAIKHEGNWASCS
jgi:hypothetical protein